MKIVIATPVYAPMINGVAVFSHNLATGLARLGHEVIVLTPSQTCKKRVRTIDGVKVFDLKSTDIKIYPDQIHQVSPKKKILGIETPRLFYKHGLKAALLPERQIKQILSEFHPDIIHVQGSDPIGVAAVKYARKHKIPVVLTEHNQPEVLTESLHLPGVVEKTANKALSHYFVNRQKKVDYVTMPTELAIKNLLNGRDLGVPVEAVSNGVDLTAFKPGKVADDIYTKYGVKKGVPIIIYIGRLDPEKKVETVLRAFKEFLDRHKLDNLSKTLFVVVGDGVAKNRLMAEAKRMNIQEAVRFLGRALPPDLYELYRMGDLFVTASEIETQGIVLIEAAATGLPLIAVKGGAVAEVCQHEVNGYLIEPGDISALAGAMGKILSDPDLKNKMSKKSLEIASRHALESTLERFVQIYEKLIKRV